jgi:hypothetical protein
MALIIKSPSIVRAAGNKEKIIKEFFGRVNSGTEELSIAMMKSPGGAEYIAICLPAFSPDIVHRDQ